MNSRKYPVQNYVPYNPNKTTTKNRTFNDLDLTLKQMIFDEIVNDPDYHFKNCFVTNFDLIHHECRDDQGTKRSRKKLFPNIIKIVLFRLQ